MLDLSYKIGGMSCSSCANTIEKALNKLEGVDSSSVNYAVETASIRIVSNEFENQVKKKITELGFSVIENDKSLNSKEVKQEEIKINDNFHKFIISLSLAFGIFFLAMWPLNGWPNREVNWYLQLLLCIPIYFWVGLKFQKSLWRFFSTGRSNMNTLIGLGTSAAFSYSFFITIASDLSIQLGLTQKVYFEAIGFIISFVFLGQYFEDKAKRKTKEAINSLARLNSKNATLLKNGVEKEIIINDVKKNDILRVRPGEKFPVDGKIINGHSSIDESMISGEPIPIDKSIGDKIYAGTINGDQVIEYQAVKVGAETFINQIIQFTKWCLTSNWSRCNRSRSDILVYIRK